MARNKYEYLSVGNYIFFKIVRAWSDIESFFFFRKFKVIGRETIPLDKPVLFTVNHQSAFIDPILLGAKSVRHPWFITRAGVFQGRFVKYIFRSIHMLPIFRTRDKVNIRKANEETFQECENILSGNGSVLIFPEGNHSMRKRLRSPLRKGFARIAFNAEAANDFKLGLVIIPTGIYYEHPMKSRTDCLINYGKPLPIAKYKEIYERNPNEAIKKLTLELEEHMPKYMVDIKPLDRYDEIEEKWWNNRPKESNLEKRLASDQEIIGKLINNEEVKQYPKRKILLKPLWLVLGFPFFIYGALNNFIAYYLTKVIIKKTMKDPHFKQSIEYATGMSLWPIMAGLQSVAVYFSTDLGVYTWLYFITTPMFGVLAYDYYDRLIRGQHYFKSSKYADMHA